MLVHSNTSSNWKGLKFRLKDWSLPIYPCYTFFLIWVEPHQIANYTITSSIRLPSGPTSMNHPWALSWGMQEDIGSSPWGKRHRTSQRANTRAAPGEYWHSGLAILHQVVSQKQSGCRFNRPFLILLWKSNADGALTMSQDLPDALGKRMWSLAWRKLQFRKWDQHVNYEISS